MKSQLPKIGVLVLGRPQFDTAFAEEVVETAWTSLQSLEAEIVGSPGLLFDAPSAEDAFETIQNASVDLLLVLQATFTDATMIVSLAQKSVAPIALWSFPEPRSGGRLRLNTVCGANLAAHALGRAECHCAFIHRDADDPNAVQEIRELAAAARVVRKLSTARIGVVGNHPDGFDSCTYDAPALKALCGATVEEVPIENFFERVKAIPADVTESVRNRVAGEIENIDELDADSLNKSLKVYGGLKSLADEAEYDGVAVRCWPEFFTELGGAACGPMGMMGEDGTPCGCEADVYGTLSSLIMSGLSGTPAFNTDLVDVDREDDTAVFWHCGQAPRSMADDQSPIRGTIHSNRKLPLLYEFPLKPGRITIGRISQSQNRIRVFVGGGEILRRPNSFSGTSGVVRFDKPVGDVLDTILNEGLEHHVSIAYGDHRPTLRRVAAMLGLAIVEMT